MNLFYLVLLLASTLSGSFSVYAENSMPVAVVRSIRTPIAEEIKLTGNLTARRISLISSEVDGIVDDLRVDAGDVVKTGELILKLDNEIASISTARSAAAVDEAQARHQEARRRFQELTELAKQKHVPATNVEAARAEIDITKAAIGQANAEHREMEALLARHTIRAPFDGVINRKIVEVGQWVETSTPLVELVETGFLRLDAPVPQFYFSRVRVGTNVVIRFDAMPEQPFEATVTTVIPVSDRAARTFPVRIDLINEGGLLAPGMSAQVTVRIVDEDDQPALLVPQDAIVRRPDGSQTVWTIAVEDGITIAQPQPVRTGRVYRNNVEILDSNIESGAQVVVRGNEILRPGQAVVVAEDSAMDI